VGTRKQDKLSDKHSDRTLSYLYWSNLFVSSWFSRRSDLTDAELDIIDKPLRTDNHPNKINLFGKSILKVTQIYQPK
jgi:hypothetical protein